MSDHNKRFHSIDEVASLLSIGKTLIYQEIRQGRLVATKVGRRTLVSSRAIDDWEKLLPVINPTEQ